jgi:hypothetical protein
MALRYASRPARPFPTAAEYARTGERGALGGNNAYIAWAVDQEMYPIILAASGALETTSGFNAWYLNDVPGETPEQKMLRYINYVAEENVKIYEANPGATPTAKASVSYERSKALLAEFKKRGIAANYNKWAATVPSHITVPPIGARRKSRRGRKHRKAKTAKRRGRR